ncbi:MAG: GTP cyclohydrolase II [Bacteroidota bacterium]
MNGKIIKPPHTSLQVEPLEDIRLPTDYGEFRMRAYPGPNPDQPHLALYRGHWDDKKPALVRMHSECMTGDVFTSGRCDCGPQLHKALELIAEEGGVLVYLRQEGRGIGLINKMKAYNLQDQGLDTADANTHLGFAVDDRRFDIAIAILEDLGVTQLNLLTNNPEKIKAFDNSQIQVVSRRPIEIPAHSENEFYLETKRRRMGHMFSK